MLEPGLRENTRKWVRKRLKREQFLPTRDRNLLERERWVKQTMAALLGKS